MSEELVERGEAVAIAVLGEHVRGKEVLFVVNEPSIGHRRVELLTDPAVERINELLGLRAVRRRGGFGDVGDPNQRPAGGVC